MRFAHSHDCCGHQAICGLYEKDIDLKTGEVCSDSYAYKPNYTPLKARLTLNAYSWIHGKGQSKQANKLASEFRKLGFTVVRINMGKNPGHDQNYNLIMFVAHKNKKKRVANKKAGPPRLRRRSVPQ